MSLITSPINIVHGEWMYTLTGSVEGPQGTLFKYERTYWGGNGRDYVLSFRPSGPVAIEEPPEHGYTATVDCGKDPHDCQPSPVPESGTGIMLISAIALGLVARAVARCAAFPGVLPPHSRAALPYSRPKQQ